MPAEHDIALVRADNPGRSRSRARTPGSSAATRAGWSTPARCSTRTSKPGRGGRAPRRRWRASCSPTRHADHVEATHAFRLRAAQAWKRKRYGDDVRGRANLVPIFAARGDADVLLADGDPAGPFTAVADARARARPPRLPAARRGAVQRRRRARARQRLLAPDPGAAARLPRRAARRPAGAARPARPRSAPATGRSSTSRARSWSSTATTAWTASAGSSRRSTAASERPTTCSTARGPTPRRCCAPPPR